MRRREGGVSDHVGCGQDQIGHARWLKAKGAIESSLLVQGSNAVQHCIYTQGTESG